MFGAKYSIAYFLVLASLTHSCKVRNAESTSLSSDYDICSPEKLKSNMQEIAGLDSELIVSEKHEKQTSKLGNCLIKRAHCESSCRKEFWGITKLLYQKGFEQCN